LLNSEDETVVYEVSQVLKMAVREGLKRGKGQKGEGCRVKFFIIKRKT